jgi:ferrochelatase
MGLGSHDGILLVAHGTVTDLDDLPAFVAKIRRGRPASPELVDELRRRYRAIGGSPLLEITRRQAFALARKLDLPVLVAMRLWHPTVEEVLAGIGGLKLDRLAIVPLAPFSVPVYWQAALESRERAHAELGDRLPELVSVEPWGSEPAFIEANVKRIRRHAEGYDPGSTILVLTAHSLPMMAIRSGDRYELEFRACADAIGASLGRPYRIAFQSQGADGGEWLGPDLKSVLAEVRAGGATRVVLAPVGFVAEHVETLYDLDIEARALADDLGLELIRVPALDDDLALIDALAIVASRALQ